MTIQKIILLPLLLFFLPFVVPSSGAAGAIHGAELFNEDFSKNISMRFLRYNEVLISAQTHESVRFRLGLWQGKSFLYSIEVPRYNRLHQFILRDLNSDTSYTVQLIGNKSNGQVLRSQVLTFRTPDYSTCKK